MFYGKIKRGAIRTGLSARDDAPAKEEWFGGVQIFGSHKTASVCVIIFHVPVFLLPHTNLHSKI
ncbi:hypothetical protein AGMMS50256_39140 [Betaproteobacteria bacterium]|nr:hypothetical protein AGMMS50256_39140 [Betaproteobacteria bacterium]